MKIKNHMRYAKKARTISRQNTGLLPNTASTSWKLYQDCSKLDLERFLDVLYDKEYDRLIIEGKPTEQTVKDAWNKIYLQYTELTNDGSYNQVLDKVTKINELNAKIYLIDGIVKHLQIGFDQELVKVLNYLGYPCDLKREDDAEKKLKPVVARAKRLILEMGIVQKELEALQSETHGTTGREYFDDWLDALSRHRAYAVKAKDIMVTQFLKAKKRLNEESIKQQQKHGRS